MNNTKLHIIRHLHPQTDCDRILLTALNNSIQGLELTVKIYDSPEESSLVDKLVLPDDDADDKDLVFVLGSSPKLVTPDCIKYACQLLRSGKSVIAIIPDYIGSRDFQLPGIDSSSINSYEFLQQTQFSALNPKGMLSTPFYLENFVCQLGTLRMLADSCALEQFKLFMLTSEAAVGLSNTALKQQAPITEKLLSTVNIYGAIKRAAQIQIKNTLAHSPTTQHSGDHHTEVDYHQNQLQPDISIVVIVYSMPLQAMNTLYSLSTRYQRQVNDSQYEVIVIENDSGNNLDPEQVKALGPQFRYQLRSEPGVSPASAINAGLALCRADTTGLMIDGARMLSPGVLRQALTAREISDHPLALVPSYDLGPELQQYNHTSGYNRAREIELLESINWPDDGYELFTISVLGEANDRGYINPLMEATCLFSPTTAWQNIGGADERFQYPGGGSLNLHMFRRLGMLANAELIVMAGEGAFHQFHGGVTTDAASDVEAKTALFQAELDQYWDNSFNGLRRMPMLLGYIPPQARGFYDYSCNRSIKRLNRFKSQQKHPWPDEPDAAASSPPYQY